jgi:hypothetical protein
MIKGKIIGELKMASRKDVNDLRGLLIPAGVITGMGVGFLIDNVVAGMFIGLGTGFALLALVAIFMPDRK